VITLKSNCADIGKEELKVEGKVIIKYFNFAGLRDVTNETKRNKLIKNIKNWILQIDVELLKFNEEKGELIIKT
jgi:hypothetical protein